MVGQRKTGLGPCVSSMWSVDRTSNRSGTCDPGNIMMVWGKEGNSISLVDGPSKVRFLGYKNGPAPKSD